MNNPSIFAKYAFKKKKGIPLLNLLINCISARSTPQILSVKGDSTFLFLKISNTWFV